MGTTDEVLETVEDGKEKFIFADITRVGKDGKNRSWERVLVKDILSWKTRMTELESLHCYATIQRFANEVHTVGEPYISPLYFDLDADDLQDSLCDARKLKDYLYVGLEIEEGVEFFFSGNRGFHITINAKLCGFDASNDLSRICKYMAVNIAEKLSLDTMDAAVYSKRRMWRMNNSRHGKTGLWKIQLTPSELGTLSVNDILTLAQQPRDIDI